MQRLQLVALLAGLAVLALVGFRSGSGRVALLQQPAQRALGDKLAAQLGGDLSLALRRSIATRLDVLKSEYGKDSIIVRGAQELIQSKTAPGTGHIFDDDLFKGSNDLIFPPGLEPDALDDEFGPGEETGKDAISCKASKQDYEDRVKAGLVDEDEKKLHEMFALVDTDKSGCVTASELYKLGVQQKESMTYEECQETPTCGMSTAEAKMAIQAMDRDKSSKIDFNEFKEYVVLKAVFDTFDKDNSGYLDEDELCAALELMGKSLSEDECKLAVMLSVDSDEDGKVSFREFRDILTTAPASTGSAGLF